MYSIRKQLQYGKLLQGLMSFSPFPCKRAEMLFRSLPLQESSKDPQLLSRELKRDFRCW